MPEPKIPRSSIRKVESERRFPLTALEGVREVRETLDHIEEDALCDSRAMGASISEIADVMQVTRQSVYNKLKAIAERKTEDARRAREALVVPDLEEQK
jgi:hypothetical protein